MKYIDFEYNKLMIPFHNSQRFGEAVEDEAQHIFMLPINIFTLIFLDYT